MLDKLKKMARQGQCRLIYLDEAGFSASAPVQYGWSARGQPHLIEPQTHCKRSVLGALDWGANCLHHRVYEGSVCRQTVVEFLDSLLLSLPLQFTVIVLDNARIHHGIDPLTLDRWFIEHHVLLSYLPAYSPELNCIEILWKHAKYHWRKITNWHPKQITHYIDELLSGYGHKFKIRFS